MMVVSNVSKWLIVSTRVCTVRAVCERTRVQVV